MLAFFRKYQRAFFIAITIVIVISFSFFGTYGSYVNKVEVDKVAFVAVDGSDVYQSELNDLINFLSSDAKNERFGPQSLLNNGLNDGVISKDFLQTGLAEVVIAPFLQKLAPEMLLRSEKEKLFVPYVQPNAPFISQEQVWTYFAPEMKKDFDALRKQSDPDSLQTFALRSKLFLAEEQFPSMYVKQIIKYQENQHPSIVPDDLLLSRDLAPFGYHTTADWFGKDFIELVAKYIINCARIAKKAAITVSEEETLNSLYTNAEEAFKENKMENFGFRSPQDYYNSTIHRMGMDQGRVVTAWHNVLLFRRYFQEHTDAILVDSIPYRDFFNSRNEFVDIELYRPQKILRLKSLRDVEKFDLYRTATVESPEAPLFASPAKSAKDVKKLFPELVKRRFHLSFASVNKEALQSKIAFRTVMQWQTKDANWKKLQQEFPELFSSKAKEEDDRLSVLDNLDAATRQRVDLFSRSQIIQEDAKWYEKALAAAPMHDEQLVLRSSGGNFPFNGITDRNSFLEQLEKAPLNEQTSQLSVYSQDNTHYYRFIVLDRGDDEVISYDEAIDDGTLDRLLNKVLELTYQRVRTHQPTQYLKENGEWKELDLVKEEIAAIYFKDAIKKMDQIVDKSKREIPHYCDFENRDQARAACYVLEYVKDAYKGIKENSDSLPTWKLEKVERKISRSGKRSPVDTLEAFSVEKHGWSKLKFSPSEGVIFFKVVEKGFGASEAEIRMKVLESKQLLSRNAALQLGAKLLGEMIEDKSIGLSTQIGADTP